MRAEFWIEGIGDVTAPTRMMRASSSVSRPTRYDSTNRKRRELGARERQRIRSQATGRAGDINEPLTLEHVPPLVFSEIMRDVDLFVGVASMGNDPTWQDGGPDGRFRDYWQPIRSASSLARRTRKQVLERLIPRLKIADRCSFSDRFLVVEGKKRTYKIHLDRVTS